MIQGKKLQLHITEEACNGERIDKYLAQGAEIGSRSRAEQLIQLQLVLVNGVAVKASYRLKINDYVEVHLPAVSSSELLPFDFPLVVVYEDEEIIVVDKPANLVVHPAHGHEQDTLVNALLHRGVPLANGFLEKRPGIVHRLDKDTSGVLVVAKTDQAHRILSGDFKSKNLLRLYRAICGGRLNKSAGTLTSHLVRHPSQRQRFCSKEKLHGISADSEGKWSQTHYQTIESSGEAIHLLELKLETGRTHQIRVHLSELGVPCLGDSTYANRQSEQASKKFFVPRCALHAYYLGFFHPLSKQWLEFQVPWPADLKNLLQQFAFTQNFDKIGFRRGIEGIKQTF